MLAKNRYYDFHQRLHSPCKQLQFRSISFVTRLRTVIGSVSDVKRPLNASCSWSMFEMMGSALGKDDWMQLHCFEYYSAFDNKRQFSSIIANSKLKLCSSYLYL